MESLTARGLTRVMTTFLLTGGTGKTGSRVAERLRARGVRAVSRSTEPAFDWIDETTWGPVLDGDVERVLGRPARDFAEYAKGAAPAWAR
jgi:nucleoside-diphosphate-sugar epimerase